MKFELFEQLRYLESHAKNSDEFNRSLRTLTPQDVLRQMDALQQVDAPLQIDSRKQEEIRNNRNCLTL